MNIPRFLIEEAACVAANGGTVLIVDRNGPAGELDAFGEAPCWELIDKVSRANGREGVDYHGGGKIRYVRNSAGARGYTADHAYFAHGLSQDEIADLIPCLATAQEHVLIGY